MEKMVETQHSYGRKYLEADNISEESKELISTLPMDKHSFAIAFYQYQGHWYFKRHLHGVLSCQKHFQALNTNIFLVTIPKSGTTWLKAWTFALLNRKRYSDINYHPLLTTNPHALVPFLELDLYIEKDSLPDFNSFSSPRLFCTHLPFVSLPKSVKESSCKVVYLCRDPKDNFVSLWHFTNKILLKDGGIHSLEVAFEKFCRGVSAYGPFWEHVLSYWKEILERPEKVMFLKYEELKRHPVFHLKKLVEFIRCPFSKEEESAGVMDHIVNLCSFEKLSNLEVNRIKKLPDGMENKSFFHHGEVGDGKKMLTNEMIEQLDSITKMKLAKHGLSF